MEEKCVDGPSSPLPSSPEGALGPEDEEAAQQLLRSEPASLPADIGSSSEPCETLRVPEPLLLGKDALAPGKSTSAEQDAWALAGRRISPTSVTPSGLWQSCMNCLVVEGAERPVPGLLLDATFDSASSSQLPPDLCGQSAPPDEELLLWPGWTGAEDEVASPAQASMPKRLSRWLFKSSGTSRRSSSCILSSTQRRNSCESC
mmetsp:Transcript_3522/g.6766  ORF Transcript_3522/g.6766 Transcript_3522/m.6766 type:complete len:203 (-) Transcript_3522:492-1100(-)